MGTRVIWATLFIAMMPGTTVLAGPQSDIVVANDDHFSTLREQGFEILTKDLLTNDQGVSDDQPVQVVSGPSHGQLSSNLGGFLYSPDPAFYGEDIFRYSVAGEVANVYLSVALRWVPISLDWDGDGRDEIGWFESEQREFYLADTLTDPVFEIWRLPASSPGGKPFAGDWDGDGFDEPAIYDPATGEIHFFKPESQGELVEVQVFSWGSLHGDIRPVAGDWDGDGVDDVGVYDPIAATFDLRLLDPSGQLVSFSYNFGIPENDNRPIAGDWFGQGFDTTGIYDSVAGVFVLADAKGDPLEELNLDLVEGENLYPVAGNWDLSGSGVGLYDPKENRLLLTEIRGGGGHPIPVFPPDHPNNDPVPLQPIGK